MELLLLREVWVLPIWIGYRQKKLEENKRKLRSVTLPGSLIYIKLTDPQKTNWTARQELAKKKKKWPAKKTNKQTKGCP